MVSLLHLTFLFSTIIFHWRKGSVHLNSSLNALCENHNCSLSLLIIFGQFIILIPLVWILCLYQIFNEIDDGNLIAIIKKQSGGVRIFCFSQVMEQWTSQFHEEGSTLSMTYFHLIQLKLPVLSPLWAKAKSRISQARQNSRIRLFLAKIPSC